MSVFEVRLSAVDNDPTFAVHARDLPQSLDDWLRKQHGGSCVGRVTDTITILEITAPSLESFRELIDAYVEGEQRRGRRVRAVIVQKDGPILIAYWRCVAVHRSLAKRRWEMRDAAAATRVDAVIKCILAMRPLQRLTARNIRIELGIFTQEKKKFAARYPVTSAKVRAATESLAEFFSRRLLIAVEQECAAGIHPTIGAALERAGLSEVWNGRRVPRSRLSCAYEKGIAEFGREARCVVIDAPELTPRTVGLLAAG